MQSRFWLKPLLIAQMLFSITLSAQIRLALLPVDTPTALPAVNSDILILRELSWQTAIGSDPSPISAGSQPLLLRLRFLDEGVTIGDSELDRLEIFLQQNPAIDAIILDLGTFKPASDQMNYLLKRISSLIKGVKTDFKIGLEADDLDSLLEAIVTQKLSSYLDALVVSSADNALQEKIMTRLPELKLWERLSPNPGTDTETARLITRLLNRPLFMTNTTSLYLCESPASAECLHTLDRLMPYLSMGLIDHMEVVNLQEEKGSVRPLPLYYKHDGVSPVIMAVIDQAGKKSIQLTPGVYENALVTDLQTGAQNREKIGRHSRSFRIQLNPSIYVIELSPRDELKRQVIEVGVNSERQLSAEEIVAKARAWMTMQSRRLHCFIADMSVNYSLTVGNLNETFDLLIRGPYFSSRGEPADWVQQDFFLNRIKWKSKKIPKIPLLQPEKVSVVPLEIELSELYQYQRSHDETLAGTAVYVIHFKPGPGLKDQSAYEGRLWISKKDGAILQKELNQLNLKGEVLSNVETQTISPMGSDGEICLPTRLVGHQIFNIAGTLTHIEKLIEYDNIRINPVDFTAQRQAARDSDARMVRDTDRGLRYLVKDSQSGERTVEWQQSKTQTAAIFGSFYDSSYEFPVPLAGINYLNFDLGGRGKGRQTNIFFAGAMLLANYTDPSLFGSGISFNANLNGIAFASRNKIYRNLDLSPGETIKDQSFKSFISFGFSLTRNVKLTAVLGADYYMYSRHKEDTNPEFILPRDNLTGSIRLKLDASFKGFTLSCWADYGRRSDWGFWGLPENDDYLASQKGFYRFRVIAAKDFHLSLFRKIQTKFTWLDSYRVDRFSAYKFGFFSELRVSGFNSGTIRAERALMFNLAYSYQLSQHFGLEFKYDSVLASNSSEEMSRQYFSGIAAAASTALPFWDNMLVKLEAGLPVVSHGVKGFVLYLMLLKMF